MKRPAFRKSGPTRRALLALATMWLAAATCLCPAAARAELLLSNPQEDAARTALWRRVWDGVPKRLRPARDVRLREVSDAEMDRLVSEDAEEARRENEDHRAVEGMYSVDGDTPTITLRRSLPDRQAVRVFAHELGHVVWDARLSRDEKRRYTDAYRASKKAGRLITEYAGESVEEGFAESFRVFLNDRDSLRKRDEASFAVLEEMSAPEKEKQEKR